MTEWFSRTYICGNGIEIKTKFPATGSEQVPKEGTKRYKRYVNRAERGATEARHEAALLLNSNFTAGEDYYLGLDYSGGGLEKLEAYAGTDDRDAVYMAAKKHTMENYLRRCRRACKKAGVEFRYFIITSDMDGKSFDPVRVHHHMVVNKEAAQICCAKWKDGGAYANPLYGEHGDLSPLAEYMINQVRYFPNEKRYTPSRNLKKPKVTPARRCKNPDAPLQVPKGCVYIHRSESYAGRPQRLRYYRPPKERGT